MWFEHVTTEVRWSLAAVLAALVAASASVFALERMRPHRDYRELRQRVRTWWVIVGLFGVSLLLTPRAAVWFLALVSLLALREYFALVPTREADRALLWWLALAIPLQYGWAYVRWYGMFIIFVPVYLFLLAPTRMVLSGETAGFLRSVGTIHWGLMTTVFSLSHAAYLLVLEPATAPRVAPAWPSAESAAWPGPGLLVLLVLLTEVNDVAQYLWGKSLGRRKVSPRVSPGKTVAGLVGGVTTTVALAAIIGPWLTLLDWPRAVGAGLIVGLFGFVGDLSISALKRDLGVKDSGTVLPGHGGILDRVDSLTYTAPLFFHYVYFWYF